MASHSRNQIAIEVERCALAIFDELAGGSSRREAWYPWYLCERHGGAPLVADCLPKGQIAYWDGDDIVIDASAPLMEIIAALPEELTHRLSSAHSERFERLNEALPFSRSLVRADFQERVGQRVAELFTNLVPHKTSRSFDSEL